jgi:hypothetical protein
MHLAEVNGDAKVSFTDFQDSSQRPLEIANF